MENHLKISKLIKLLQSEMEREGDMPIHIYDSHGDRIKPTGINVGSICQGGRINDFAYLSDLD